jgi:hypothetical protein
VSTTDAPSRPPREEILPAVVGLVAWAIALVVLAVFFRHDLARHHASWWLGACGYGLALGLYGLRFAYRRAG